MKVLLVAGKLTYSNPTTYTQLLAQGLHRRGYQVQLAALGGPLLPQIERLGVECYQVKQNLFSFRRLLQFLRDFGPDVVHATGGPAALSLGSRFIRRLGSPLVHTVHSWLPHDQRESVPRTVRGIVAVSQDLREHLVNDLNIPKASIRVIPYGVEPPERESEVVDFEGRMPVVGTIGRLDKGRRHHEFLDAARLVHERLPEVQFMIAGEGPNERVLRQRVRQLDLRERVTFVQPHTEFSKIFPVLDILVIVSDGGGVGLNLLEGMVHGCPVIATGGGEIFAILGQEGICILVPSGDAATLADQVCALLGERDRRLELRESARNYVKTHYPLDAMVSRTEDYYGEIVSKSSG